ncbi:MAG TPA: AAA family ATPase, partial [Xanthobacteraceae bacterium]|nr:AAA family ATPase [Xanthobacteraceae bacterium]
AREKERAGLVSDSDLGTASDERIAEIDGEIASLEEKLAGLESEWDTEQKIVNEIRSLREILSSEAKTDGKAQPAAQAATEVPAPAPAGADVTPAIGGNGKANVEEARKQLREKFEALEGRDPEKRMIYAHVDEQAVASVVADWTGIPVGRMVKDEIETILTLADTLNRRVVGQSHGLKMIAKRIETNRAKLDNPNKPIGVFMLAGPSGVGKTETALALAEALYGGEQNMITINMSEFQEAHTVSTLKGAPPGYVGYGEGGRLTEAVRRKPYSVVLLDEVEKAHPDVHELFFQVFDKGQMEDGTGRRIDFKNTLIILTTNVGTDLIMSLSRDPMYRENPEALAQQMRPELLKVFPAALLGRIVSIPYFPLSDEMLGGIVRLQLGRIAKRIRENHEAALVYGDDVINHIISMCNDPESGGRMVDNIITNTMLPALSREFLTRSLAKEEPKEARVTIENGDFAYAWA